MTLQDWFYIIGIVYFSSWIMFLLGLGIAGFVLYTKVIEMQRKAEQKVESMKASFQNIPVLKITSVGTFLPIAAWIAKKISKRFR